MDKRKRRRLERKRRVLMHEIRDIMELQQRACLFFDITQREPYYSDVVWQAMVVKTGYIYGIKKLVEKHSDLNFDIDFFSGCVMEMDTLRIVNSSYSGEIEIDEDDMLEIASELESETGLFCDMLLSVYEYFGWECHELMDMPGVEAYLCNSRYIISEDERNFVSNIVGESYMEAGCLYSIRNERLESLWKVIQNEPKIKQEALISDIIQLAVFVGNPCYTFYDDYVGAFDMNGAVGKETLGSRFYFSMGYLSGWDTVSEWYRLAPLQLLLIEAMDRLLDMAELRYPQLSQLKKNPLERKVG